MSDWSGLCSASSLPVETLQRMSMNARLVEHAARTPEGSVFESFASRHQGIPVFVENLVGGASAVSVNSFNRFQPGGRVVEPIDNWDRNHLAQTRFHGFFTGYVSGRLPVRESLPAYNKAIGPVSYGGRNKQRNRPAGTPDWYQSLPGEPGFGEPANMNRRRHPAYGGYTDGTEEEARLHDGDCGSVHPTLSHGDWVRGGEEEEEEMRRSRARTSEAYLITLVKESDDRQLRSWAIKKLAGQ